MPKLFIDTHSEKVTLAVVKGDKIIKKQGVSNRSHSEIVAPLLNELLRETNMEFADFDEIAVVNGPGSFTGVRIGVTIAKTIAYSLSIPIKVLSSLEMYGESATEYFDLVTVEDSKGVYSAHKKENCYEEFIYQRKGEFEDYVSKNGFTVLKKHEINLKKIFEYLADRDECNPHVVNPTYVKEIDALK